MVIANYMKVIHFNEYLKLYIDMYGQACNYYYLII